MHSSPHRTSLPAHRTTVSSPLATESISKSSSPGDADPEAAEECTGGLEAGVLPPGVADFSLEARWHPASDAKRTMAAETVLRGGMATRVVDAVVLWIRIWSSLNGALRRAKEESPPRPQKV